MDESFKRPGTVPFKWELQPGIPKQQPAAAGAAAGGGDDDDGVPPPPATPRRLALPPAARVGVPCRRTSSSVVSPLSSAPPSHRRSMSARFATSLALVPMPFTRRRGNGQGRGGAAAAKDDDVAGFCLLYAEN